MKKSIRARSAAESNPASGRSVSWPLTDADAIMEKFLDLEAMMKAITHKLDSLLARKHRA
jgi:hypothetical protein